MIDNTLTYMVLTNSSDTIKLTAGFDWEKDKFYIPYLTFQIKGEVVVWDGSKWIFKNFYKMLKRYKISANTKKDIKVVKECQKDGVFITEELVNDCLGIIEKAKLLGWNKLN